MEDPGIDLDAQAMDVIDDPNSWEIEKARLEQVQFNLNEELRDATQHVQELSMKNAQMAEELNRHSTEVAEHQRNRNNLEKVRNELVQKKIDLEATVAKLQMEKEERENTISVCNKEKQASLVEIFALKDQIKQLAAEKVELQLTADEVKQDKKTIAFEREKFEAGRQMHDESRKWFMNEVSERDKTISSLRLELSYKDIAVTNEVLQYKREKEILDSQVEDLKEKLELARSNNTEYLKRMEEIESAKNAQIANLEAEVRCQEELRSSLEEMAENAKFAGDHFRDQYENQQNVVEEVKSALSKYQEESEREKAETAAAFAEKDRSIEFLKSELARANDMLKSNNSVNFNVTEEELAELSPDAAETAKLLKGGYSLTGIFREYARACGERTLLQTENNQLMNTLEELTESIRENGPALAAQRNITDNLFDKSERYEAQLEEAEIERKNLMQDRDFAQRELAYTQAELEKAQRDYHLLSKRNVELLFIIERPKYANEPGFDDEKLMTSIQQLQQRNVQLESDIEHEKESAAQAAMNAQSEEMTRLRTNLSASIEAETKLKAQLEQLTNATNVLKSQTEHLKELVKDSVSSAEARTARIRAEEATNELMTTTMKVKRLEDLIEVLKTERERREQELMQRLESAESTSNLTKENSVALSIALETQKALTVELQQAIKSYEKEAETARREMDKVIDADSKKSQQLNDVGQRLLASSDELGSLRVKCRALEDELKSLKTDNTYLRTENESQRAISQRENQWLMSMSEMSNRLARVEAEKQNHSSSQVEVLRLERDSLKQSTARLTDQLTHTKNETRIQQKKLEEELESIRAQLAEKEQQNSSNEAELNNLRSKLTAVQAHTGADTFGMTPDRLKKEYQQMKTRYAILENQLVELKTKLMEAEAEKAKRDNESAMVESHSNALEENLKQTEMVGAMERERLEAKAKSHESRAQELSESLAKLREEHAQLQNEYDVVRLDCEKEVAELRRQLDVAALNMCGVKEDLDRVNTLYSTLKQESGTYTSQLEAFAESERNYENRIMELDTARARLESQFNDKSMALIAETDAKNNADQMRQAVEVALQKKEEEREKIENDAREKMAEYDQKLLQLSQQYESIKSTQTASDVSLLDSDQSMEHPTENTNVIESLQNLVQFVRQDKDKAMARAMNAEIEMRRLRAETSEFERSRNELLIQIRDLETERTANAAALVERAKLLEKVESLTNVQSLNAKLNNEKTKLVNQLAKLQQDKVELDKKDRISTAHQNELNMKNSTLSQENTQRKKEIELLKARLENTGRTQNSNLTSQLEQAKATIAQLRAEVTTANNQANEAESAKNKAEENAKASNSKFIQTRALAVKYRDELAKVKNEKKPNVAEDGSQVDQSVVKALTEEVETLKKDKAALEQKLTEADISKIRTSALESKCNQLTKQLEKLTADRDQLMQTTISLSHDEKNRGTTGTDVESKPKTTASTSKVAPVRPTGSVVSPFNPAHAPPLAASTPINPRVESDQASINSAASSAARSRVGQTPTTPANRVLTPVIRSVNNTPAQNIPNEPTTEIIPPVPSDNIPDPTPTTRAAIPPAPTFPSAARVPAQTLFSNPASEAPPNAPEPRKGTLPSIDPAPSVPRNVTYSPATSSRFGPGQQLFGNSGAPELNKIQISTSSSADNMILPEESVAETAEQSSYVSGSVDKNKTAEIDMSVNVLDGESRDSTVAAGVSSSDGRRKRPANDFEATDAKRQRESPNEAVTSSGSRPPVVPVVVAEIPELDEEVIAIENEISDEDHNDTLQQRNDVVVLENDEEVLGDDVEEVDEEDEGAMDEQSFENDQEYDEEDEEGDEDVDDDEEDDDDDDIEIIEEVAPRQNNEEVDSNSDDDETLNELEDAVDQEDDEEDDDEPIVINDDPIEDMIAEDSLANDDIIEVLGGEDSQPSLEDQDREAASAVEEAEDEGRDPVVPFDDGSAPADPSGASGSGNIGHSQPDFPRVRMPIVMDAERDDQCSSSNETAEGSSGAQRGMGRGRFGRGRGAKPSRGIYQPPNSGRGGGAPPI